MRQSLAGIRTRFFPRSCPRSPRKRKSKRWSMKVAVRHLSLSQEGCLVSLRLRLSWGPTYYSWGLSTASILPMHQLGVDQINVGKLSGEVSVLGSKADLKAPAPLDGVSYKVYLICHGASESGLPHDLFRRICELRRHGPRAVSPEFSCRSL